MTRFTVVWDKDVEASFVSHWLAGSPQLRTILTDIANWVDKNLAEDPDRKGYLRADLNVRIIAVPVQSSPMRASVTFEVSLGD